MRPRHYVVILMNGVFWSGLFTTLADGQEQPREAAGFDFIRIIDGNAEIRRSFDAARDAIKKEDWQAAVQSLQSIHDNKEDFYIKVTERDAAEPKREIVNWSSAKFVANGVLGRLPPKGLEAYERAYGPQARKMLTDAGKKEERVVEVAQRYYHTKAGIEANEWFAELRLAQGQVFVAALRFEKLLSVKHAQSQISDVTLFKAAIAFHRSGDSKNFEQTWKRLTANIESKKKGGLQVGDQFLSVERLLEIIREPEKK